MRTFTNALIAAPGERLQLTFFAGRASPSPVADTHVVLVIFHNAVPTVLCNGEQERSLRE